MFLVLKGTGGLVFVAPFLVFLGQRVQVMLHLGLLYFFYVAGSRADVVDLMHSCLSGLNGEPRWSKCCWAGLVVAAA